MLFHHESWLCHKLVLPIAAGSAVNLDRVQHPVGLRE